jgi:hypothetical protein
MTSLWHSHDWGNLLLCLVFSDLVNSQWSVATHLGNILMVWQGLLLAPLAMGDKQAVSL